jgi:hypothetical protein
VRRTSSQGSVADYGGLCARGQRTSAREPHLPIQAISLALISSLNPFDVAALFLLFQASRPKAALRCFWPALRLTPLRWPPCRPFAGHRLVDFGSNVQPFCNHGSPYP